MNICDSGLLFGPPYINLRKNELGLLHEGCSSKIAIGSWICSSSFELGMVHHWRMNSTAAAISIFVRASYTSRLCTGLAGRLLTRRPAKLISNPSRSHSVVAINVTYIAGMCGHRRVANTIWGPRPLARPLRLIRRVVSITIHEMQ